MNSFTNTILTLLLGWLRTLLNAARDFVSSDSSTAFFNFFRDNWRVLFLVLCIVGFALDTIVYLVRWRPRPLWRRRKARHARELPPPQEEYDFSTFNADTPAIPTGNYKPAPEYAYDDYSETKPTAQYQMQPRQGGQVLNAPPATLPYTTPRFAPEASAYQEEIPPLYTDEPVPNTASAQDAQQRFAFGMAPSFGSAQSEPAYSYHRDAAPTFAPPQYSQEHTPAQPYTQPPQHTALEPEASQQAYQQPSPYFRPFSDRTGATFAPPKTRGLGAVAKRARTLLNNDEAYDSLSYKDVQPTVDVSKAFHSPVYPEKKPEEDA